MPLLSPLQKYFCYPWKTHYWRLLGKILPTPVISSWTGFDFYATQYVRKKSRAMCCRKPKHQTLTGHYAGLSPVSVG